jgi:hypothetical protein
MEGLPGSCFANLRRLALYGVLPEAPLDIRMAVYQAEQQQQEEEGEQQQDSESEDDEGLVQEPANQHAVGMVGILPVVNGPHLVALHAIPAGAELQLQPPQQQETPYIMVLPLDSLPQLKELIISAEHSSQVGSDAGYTWALDLEALPSGLRHLALEDPHFVGIGPITHRAGGWGGEPLLPSLQSLVLLHPKNLCIPGVFGGSPLTRLVLLGDCGCTGNSVGSDEYGCACSGDAEVLAEVFPELEVLQMAVEKPLSSCHLLAFQQLRKLRRLSIAAPCAADPKHAKHSSSGGGGGSFGPMSSGGLAGAAGGNGLARSGTVLQQLVQLPQLQELEYRVTGSTPAAALAGVTALHGGVTRLRKLILKVERVGPSWVGWREALGLDMEGREMQTAAVTGAGGGGASSRSSGGSSSGGAGDAGVLQPHPLPAFAPLPNIWVQPKKQTDEVHELLRSGRGGEVLSMVQGAVKKLITHGRPETVNFTVNTESTTPALQPTMHPQRFSNSTNVTGASGFITTGLVAARAAQVASTGGAPVACSSESQLLGCSVRRAVCDAAGGDGEGEGAAVVVDLRLDSVDNNGEAMMSSWRGIFCSWNDQ